MHARTPNVCLRTVTGLLAATVLTTVAVGTASAAVDRSVRAPRSASDCLVRLDCRAVDINEMTVADRLAFVRGLEAGRASQVVAGFNRWRNIEGVLEFFLDHNLGAPGTWISYVDAGILEGIERGTAIATGLSADDFGNPGSKLWSSYLDRLRRGELTERSVHDRAWGDAEQASTDYATRLAEAHGTAPTDAEWRFFLYSQSYRWLLRHEPLNLMVISVVLPGTDEEIVKLRTPFLYWMTDVTNDVPTRKGAEVAYHSANLDAVPATVSAVDLLLAYLPDLFHEFCEEAQGKATV
jgi:hypothetical protein